MNTSIGPGLRRGLEEKSDASCFYTGHLAEEPRLLLSRLAPGWQHESSFKKLLELYFCGKRHREGFVLGVKSLLQRCVNFSVERY